VHADLRATFPLPLKLALKIDADTYRGTREGVPRLIEILRRHDAGATFFFSLGPDRSGLYGKVLPAPEIGRRCAGVMRDARDAGFEIGLQAWNCVTWRRVVATADAEWTASQMALAIGRYEDVLGERAAVHAAPACTMNRHAFRYTQAFSFDYSSDTRGTHPFIPVLRAEIVACPQVPTTLPRLEELQHGGASDVTAAERLLDLTRPPVDEPKGAREPPCHVYSLSASVEGTKRSAILERLLEGWKAQGHELVPLRDVLAQAALSTLPMHSVIEASVPGKRGVASLQGPEFLGTCAG
jgi:undecaprenyl phosphate-alpha-L-ara4FN deformylase